MRTIILSILFLIATVKGEDFNATANVESGFHYGIEWFDGDGNIQAWTYFNVVREPWEGGFRGYQYWAGRVCCGFDVYIPTEAIGDPVVFPWPVQLLEVPDIDPGWGAVQVNYAWAYDYPNYAVNDGWPSNWEGYANGNIWIDCQNQELLCAFGDKPSWWIDPLSFKKSHGKGHNK